MFRVSGSFAVALLSIAVAVRAQDPAAPPKPDKEVAETLAKLKEVVEDRKCARDAEGLELITALVKKWEGGLVDKDKKDVVKGLQDVFTKGKLREPDKMQIYTGAAAALGQCGADGSKPLQAAFTDKRFPDREQWVPFREVLLKWLGKTKDEAMVKFLTDIARRDPEPALQAAAGEALGNFEESKQELRKEIVNNLLIKYGEMDSRARVIDPADIEAQNIKKRLNVVSGKWNDALRRLTRQTFDNYPDWQAWYNKNKAKDWK